MNGFRMNNVQDFLGAAVLVAGFGLGAAAPVKADCSGCIAAPSTPVANASAATVNNLSAGKQSWWPLLLMGGGAPSMTPSQGSDVFRSMGAWSVGFGPFSAGDAPAAVLDQKAVDIALARDMVRTVMGSPNATPVEKVLVSTFAAGVVPSLAKALEDTSKAFSLKKELLKDGQAGEALYGEEQEDGSRALLVPAHVASAVQLFGQEAGVPSGTTSAAFDSAVKQRSCVVVYFDESEATAGGSPAERSLKKRVSKLKSAASCDVSFPAYKFSK